MQKLIFKEIEFDNINNDNFQSALAKCFGKVVYDKNNENIIYLGGLELLKWNNSFPLLSVFSEDIYPSLKKIQKFVYLQGKKKYSEKYWKKDLVFAECFNQEKLST